jgi:hypothetical protein
MKLNSSISLTGFIVLSFASLCMAQPQLTVDDLPSAGDKKIDYVADSTGIEPGPAGASVTWDFSTLKRISSMDSISSEVVVASSTPYASDFPAADLATKSVSGSSWAYYSSNSTQAALIGVVVSNGSTTVKQKYSDPQIIIKVPFSYNQSMTDAYEASYDASGVTIYRTGTSTATADAYGTLIMPHRTYTNVLRVKNVSSTKDSFDFFGDWFITTTDATSYSYISPGRTAALLTIMYVSTTTNGIPSDGTKTVTFNDTDPLASVRKLPALSGKIDLYPNPATENSTIRIDVKENTQVRINICSTLGQSVFAQTAQVKTGTNNVTLPLNGLNSGVYFVNVSDGVNTSTQRLIIK